MTYEFTFSGQAGRTLRAQFDDCTVTTGLGTTLFPALAAKPGLNRIEHNERLHPFPLGCQASELATHDEPSPYRA